MPVRTHVRLASRWRLLPAAARAVPASPLMRGWRHPANRFILLALVRGQRRTLLVVWRAERSSLGVWRRQLAVEPELGNLLANLLDVEQGRSVESAQGCSNAHTHTNTQQER
jgi:hypothetical protein